MRGLMLSEIRIGTRPSPLALRQVTEILERLSGVRVEIVPIKTRGDIDKKSSLLDREGSDFFTREIEQALIAWEIDAAVHSAKDLEDDMPGELVIAAITPSISPFECLVSRSGLALDKLPSGAVIGTSSRKRTEAILRFRSDLTVKPIRGDIDQRLAELDAGSFDAIITAHAALIRLGYKQRIAQVISPSVIGPHPLQGKLAIQVHRERKDLVKIFKELLDEEEQG